MYKYKQILRDRLHVHCVLGLTATATHTTIDDVTQHFGICRENIITKGSILPDHLCISASCEDDKDKVINKLKCIVFPHSCQPCEKSMWDRGILRAKILDHSHFWVLFCQSPRPHTKSTCYTH